MQTDPQMIVQAEQQGSKEKITESDWPLGNAPSLLIYQA